MQTPASCDLPVHLPHPQQKVSACGATERSVAFTKWQQVQYFLICCFFVTGTAFTECLILSAFYLSFYLK